VRLVERAGQGVDDIFKFTIQEGKGIPDFSKSDKSEVVLEIPAQSKGIEFVKFLSSIAKKDNIELDFDDIYELENIRENKKASNPKIVEKLINLGIIEKIPYKRNQYMLCKKYYVALDRKGEYTRTKGLDRDTYKALLVKHIENYGKGCMKEFIEVLPNLKRTVIYNLVRELSKTDDIEFVGQKKNGFWIKKRKTI
jgi:ATP-dependent DNA helicase RecG